MRTVIGLALVLTMVVGCVEDKKTTKPDAGGTTPQGSSGVAGTGTPGGPGYAAVQSVRGAVKRVVAQNNMKNLHTFINTASLASGEMPTIDQIKAAVRKGDQKTYKMIEKGDIVLTGAKKRGGTIWAYTKNPQHGGMHFVLTTQGVEKMSPNQLQSRLQGR